MAIEDFTFYLSFLKFTLLVVRSSSVSFFFIYAVPMRKRTLGHEFHISYSHTECYLRFREAKKSMRLPTLHLSKTRL